MKLVFNQDRIPRTTTREQWRKIWRWKREIEKRLSAEEAEMIEQIKAATSELVLYGTATVHTRFINDTFDHLINPPIMVFP